MKRLKKNDYIGVISTSGLLKDTNREDIKKSILNAKEVNLNVKLGKYLYKEDVNNIIENKLSDFNEMLNDKKVKMIIFSKGGNNSIDLLEYLDYDLISKTKKIFVGLSDLTIILNAIYAKTSLITFHFTIFKAFLKGNKEFNKNSFIEMFYDNKKTINFTKNVETLINGVAKGTLIGGNLVSFNKLINTPYLPNVDNSILFFEECDEISKEEVKAIILNLKNNHIFDKCNGLIIGNYSIDNEFFKEIFLKYIDVPMIKCEDFGHIPNNIVLPIGANVEFDANNAKINIIDNIFDYE